VFVSHAARTNSVKILADDSETMTETVESALAPLLIFGSFFGLGMFEYPCGQPRAYLSYLYALAIWGGSLTYFFYYIISIIQNENRVFIIYTIKFILVNILIPISFCRFKVKIFKCTPGPYMIIFNFILLIFLFNNIFN